MAHNLASSITTVDGDADETLHQAIRAQSKYDEEREKRLAYGRDISQYRVVDGQFALWLPDPWEKEVSRNPVYRETDVLILGGGYGSQLVAVELLKYGVQNFLMVDKCGGFGGTWWWNRYPGAQCDIESFIYMPLLEETGYVPTEKYAHQPELKEHAERIAKQYGLYEKAIFQTEVLSVHWEEYKGVWRVITNRNDTIYARFVVLNSGPLHRPKLPGTPGIEKFKGHAFHSSRFDYDYCGQDLSKLHDKRVAIIGTGATAVQIIPHVAKAAKEFLIVQRTPSGVDERLNRETDDEWIKNNIKSGWQKQRQHNFNNQSLGDPAGEDLVDDNWSRVFLSLAKATKNAKPEEVGREVLRANFARMQSIRDRVDSTIEDPELAAKLKPWYGWGCKRPTFHDDYLPSFNRPNVHLIDTEGKGVDEFTERGFKFNGIEHEVDVVIFATGYELATDWVQRAGMDVYGRVEPISKKWADGVVGLHSWGSNGFPNAFWITSAQGPLAVNALYAIHEQAIHLSYIIHETLKRGAKSVEPTREAELAWLAEVLRAGKIRNTFEATCTPGWMNNEGHVTEKHVRNWWYGGNGLEYFKMVKEWRDSGKLEGVRLTY